MIEITKKSVVPVYGLAAVWVLYCVLFPLHSFWHFVALACVGLVTFAILSLIFPGKTISVEAPVEPIRTGDEKVDALLVEGGKSLDEMKKLRDAIPNDEVKTKADQLINITDQIFKKLQAEPSVFTQVKRFADFFLPTSVKLLSTYSQFDQSGVEGENIKNTKERIDAALDMTLSSYKKFYDSLFENQALDIETDISVMETMFKKDGILENDFKVERKEE